uniref:Uncharacterized protein n=1 Tax=Arundo donax TaxID=35708 RepID=A0A0A9A8C9_ARUDO
MFGLKCLCKDQKPFIAIL